MYIIHLKGSKKAVYMIRHNLLGYGLPEIQFEKGTDDNFVMHCTLETRHDAIPNQHGISDSEEIWDGTTINLSNMSLSDIQSGKYDGEYESHELQVLSGLFNVEIEILNDPEDKWWEDAELDPQYPFYGYANGKTVKDYYEESNDSDVFSF